MESLIKIYEHWLPICLIEHGMFYNWDSSRIEGFLGLLKGNYVIKNLKNFCSVLKTQNFSTYNRTFKNYSQLPLIPQRSIMNYGRMILGFLYHEY